MKNKFKKALRVLKEKGLREFTKKTFHFSMNFLRSIIRPFFLKSRKYVLGKLKKFSSDDPVKNFKFITYSFGGMFAPMQIGEEFLSLLKIFKDADPTVIMEIGTANGGALFCFARMASKGATLISIDLPEGKFGGGYSAEKIPFYEAFAKPGQDLYLLREDSHVPETLKKAEEILRGRQIDFLFIDGDHSYEGVKKDFEMYSPLVRKGGIVAFHDVAPKGIPELTGGVPRFWKEISDKYSSRVFIKDMDQTGFGIGVLSM